MSGRIIRIGSRESRLAVIQSEIVAETVRKILPEAVVELVTMKTIGDRILDRPLDQIGGKGLFVKELDRALLENRCDLCVHSLKDMPMELPDELPILAYTRREDVRDALVLRGSLRELPARPVIGTGSRRRRLQAARLYPNAEFRGIRGNLMTRLKKLDEGEFDALILSAAGLKRLGLGNRISRYFSAEEIIPSAGQGILAVQGRREGGCDFLRGADDSASRLMALAERAFVRTLDGGCSLPTAAVCEILGDRLLLRGLYYEEETGRCLTGEMEGSAEEPEELGIRLALSLRGGQSGSSGTEERRTGKVWLLGAGPGDAQLLTVKGERVLREAQVVVYDALVGDGILSLIPEEAEQIYVGKRGGCHAKSQSEIEEILISAARRADRVVRLKGGDPFVFGRGSEEALALRAEKIPFEVVPGVTSAVAVPAYAGIPVTHRGLSSSFHVITGHGKNGEPAPMDYEALSRLGGTLVFLMGAGAVKPICEGLLAAGMDKKTPAALLQEGTTAGQRTVVSVLADLAEDGRKAGVRPPAVIVIGDVCALEESCRWAQELPLFGRKVLVTRPRSRAARMAGLLRREGAEVMELPAVRTDPVKDRGMLEEALGRIGEYDWLALTSPSGAEHFLALLRERRQDLRSLSGVKLAVIGRGTAEILERAGLYPDYVPERFYARELGLGLAGRVGGDERVLILRAREASDELTIPLRGQGISFEELPLYETVIPGSSPQVLRVRERLAQKKFDFVTFTSASTVRGFMELLTPGAEELSGFTAVCIGEQTRDEAEKYGMHCIVSRIPSMESMVERMEET